MLRLVAIPAVLALLALPRQDPAADYRKFADDWAAACSKGDSRAIGAMYTTDAVLIDADGTRKVGRAAIEKYLADLFAGPLKGVKCGVAVASVRFLKPDIAEGEGTYSFDLPGKPIARGLWMNTSVKQGTKWMFSSDIGVMPPPPPPAPPKKP